MKPLRKNIFILFLLFTILNLVSLQVSANTTDLQISPRYLNMSNYTAVFSITDPETAVVDVWYYGKEEVFSRAEITVKIQKKILVFWTDVDIGYANNVWTDSNTQVYGSFFNTFSINGAGKYRALITLKVFDALGSCDTIEMTREYEYK
ncbi:MAG: hypothetical protein E7581_03895 [Ruminococcaceae bacterium]|nr:hypothetical protein [Oscillospiraceae bacterium]